MVITCDALQTWMCRTRQRRLVHSKHCAGNSQTLDLLMGALVIAGICWKHLTFFMFVKQDKIVIKTLWKEFHFEIRFLSLYSKVLAAVSGVLHTMLMYLSFLFFFLKNGARLIRKTMHSASCNVLRTEVPINGAVTFETWVIMLGYSYSGYSNPRWMMVSWA